MKNFNGISDVDADLVYECHVGIARDREYIDLGIVEAFNILEDMDMLSMFVDMTDDRFD